MELVEDVPKRLLRRFQDPAVHCEARGAGDGGNGSFALSLVSFGALNTPEVCPACTLHIVLLVRLHPHPRSTDQWHSLTLP